MKNLIAIFALGTAFYPAAATANEPNITHDKGSVHTDPQAGVTESSKFFQPHTTVSSSPSEKLFSNQPTVVPETTSIALGLLGLLLILRRRK